VEASTGALGLAASAFRDGAGAAAASDKHKSTNVMSTPFLFYYTVMQGDLYPDVIMMLHSIEIHNKQHCS